MVKQVKRGRQLIYIYQFHLNKLIKRNSHSQSNKLYSMTTIKAQTHQSKLPIATLHLKQPPIDTNRNFNKIATLEPYMADIQKKLKFKNKLYKNNKHKLNQSSSRSFRIKDISTSSLHKLTFEKIDNNCKTIALQKNKETVNTTALLNNPKKIKHNHHNQQLHRQRKAKSQQQRPFQSSFSKTINVRQANNLTALNGHKQAKDSRQLKVCVAQVSQRDKQSQSNTFNDYLMRNNNKAKENKQQKFRKNMYEMILPKKNSVTSQSKKGSESIKKISCTELHMQKCSKKKESQQQLDLINVKRTQIVRKNNFRRGKYQIAMHSSVNENLQTTSQHNPMHSQRMHNHDQVKLIKKDSTLSINHEMDILAQKQMVKFYQKIRNKQIQKSLEKSTEKYFGSDTYRPVKSKNQIQSKYFTQSQVYLSSLINPSINKTSQSTYDKDQKHKSPLHMKHKTDCYAYDFQFQDEKSPIQNKINQVMENSQQYEESISQDKLFEQQRRQAEINYFHKQNPNINWSDQDCQVDDV